MTLLQLIIFQAVFILITAVPSYSSDTKTGIDNQELQEKKRQIAESLQWKRLLHYHRFFPWDSVRGEVDGEGFYLSPEGRDQPLAELEATLEGFESDKRVGKLKQKVLCAFPERYQFLKKNLGIKTPPPLKGECPEYEEFMQKVDSKGVTLVFSSAFASNPGSMFGHTLFKLVRNNKSDLLDQGVSFAASVPPTEGGIIYVIYGLLGGYAGQFSFRPYYEKVHEYINSESRDLWEYSLNLTPEESHSLINHLWELEANSWFDYYFINKNCSYQLLTAIEAVKPEWDLSSGWYFVVPAETVKRILEIPGAITRKRYRPSLRRKMKRSFEVLTIEEKSIFAKLIDRKILSKDVVSNNVITAGLEYVQYYRAESNSSFGGDLKQFWSELLQRRNELVTQNQEKNVAQIHAYEDLPTDPPEKGHGPFRLGLSQGFSRRGSEGSFSGFQEFHLKPAYHDLLNDDRGYLSYSEIDFPNLTFRYYPGSRTLNLEQLQFVGMYALPPWNSFEKRISWKVNVEVATPKDLFCTDCHVLRSEMGWGTTLNLLSPKNIAYALGGAYVDIGSGLGRLYRWGPDFDVGVLSNPWDPYKIRLRSRTYFDIFQSDRPLLFETLELDQSYSWLPHWEVRVHGNGTQGLSNPDKKAPIYYEGKLSLNYYF